MRYFSIVFFCVTSVCLAQETYHNEEFGFTIGIPSQWYATSENEWSDELKTGLEKLYSNKVLLILNPLDTNPINVPSIIILGAKLERTTTTEAIEYLKKNGKEELINSAKYMAEGVLGRKIKKYSVIDNFYDYNPAKKCGISKIIYQHNYDGIFFLSARAKFVGLKRLIDFRGYWEGDDPKEFRQVFNEILDSFEFDPDAKPKGMFGAIPREIKEIGGLSKEQKLKRIWKWAGTILTILIIFGVAKTVLGRYT